MFLGQRCASKLWTFTGIRGFEKFTLFPLDLCGALIFCSAVVSDDELLHVAGTLLLSFSVLFMWDALSLKELGNLISSGDISLTDSCLSIGGNNSILPLRISLSFPSSVNNSSIVKWTTELLLNSSNVLLLLWVECIDDFRSGSDVTPDKHFKVGSVLFLGWCDVATSHNVKSTLKQRCVRQRFNLQRSTTLK